jgi:hypothetical protein
MSHYRKFKYWIFAIVDKMFRYLLKEGEYSRHPKHTPKIKDKVHKVIPFEARLSSLERRVKAAREQK